MAKAETTDAEIITRVRALRDYGSARKAGAALGVNSQTILNAKTLANERGLTADTPVHNNPLVKLELENKRLKGALAKIEHDNLTTEEVRSKIYGLAAYDPTPPEWVLGKTIARGKSLDTPITIWSDWHRAEIVRPDEVNGLNEFTSDIHDKRVKKLVSKTIDLAFNYNGRSKGKPPGIIVMLGGDFINGDIHEDLVLNADRTTQQNINELTDLLAGAIDTMATKFGKVFLPCVVGNHGRATLKKRTSPLVHTSHEWNIYTNLERSFRQSKAVKFAIATGPDYHFKSMGHRYMLTHGDWLGTKGGDGIIGALGPITRGTFKIRNAESQLGRDIDTIVMGHWHQELFLPSVIVNNSLKGFDPFAHLVLRAPYSRPSQNLWWTHPEQGITARRGVYLEDKRSGDVSKKWVEFQ